MNAEQRRRYLKERVTSTFNDVIYEIKRLNFHDDNDLLTIEQKYNQIKSGKAKLRPWSELQKSYRPDINNLYIFPDIHALEESNKLNKTIVSRVVDALEEQKVSFLDKVCLSPSLDKSLDLLEEAKKTVDKFKKESVEYKTLSKYLTKGK